MDTKKINIILAEFCGWDCDPMVAREWESRGQWARHSTVDGGTIVSKNRIPDYCNDLNAIHEVEAKLTSNQRFEYFYNLNDAVGLVNSNSPAWIKEFSVIDIATASAQQRAEALVKTLDKWVDEV
jgi:hypothetical protein